MCVLPDINLIINTGHQNFDIGVSFNHYYHIYLYVHNVAYKADSFSCLQEAGRQQ